MIYLSVTLMPQIACFTIEIPTERIRAESY